MATALLPLFLLAFAAMSEAVLEVPLYLQRLDERAVGKEFADIFVLRTQVGNPGKIEKN